MKFTLGRVGLAGGHINRRNASCEDIQYLLKDANVRYAEGFNWLKERFRGKYSIDLIPTFSTLGSAFHVVITLNDEDSRKLLEDHRAENLNIIKIYDREATTNVAREKHSIW